MPVASVAKLVGEHDTKLWRLLHHHVDEARAKVDMSSIARIGIDETAAKRGHNYITLVKAADTLRSHMAGVLRWFTSGLANGLLEGINSLLQAAKSKARGYRTIRNLVRMAYLIAGNLKFDLTPAWQTARL